MLRVKMFVNHPCLEHGWQPLAQQVRRLMALDTTARRRQSRAETDDQLIPYPLDTRSIQDLLTWAIDLQVGSILCHLPRGMGNGKGKKIVIFKYKAKTRYRRRNGHRQLYTDLKVTGIST